MHAGQPLPSTVQPLRVPAAAASDQWASWKDEGNTYSSEAKLPDRQEAQQNPGGKRERSHEPVCLVPAPGCQRHESPQQNDDQEGAQVPGLGMNQRVEDRSGY